MITRRHKKLAKQGETQDIQEDALNKRHGQAALAWVTAHNRRTLATFDCVLEKEEEEEDTSESETEYQASQYQPASIIGYIVHHFPQKNSFKGKWRKTTLTDYPNKSPAWETLIDLSDLPDRLGWNRLLKVKVLKEQPNANWCWNKIISSDNGRHLMGLRYVDGVSIPYTVVHSKSLSYVEKFKNEIEIFFASIFPRAKSARVGQSGCEVNACLFKPVRCVDDLLINIRLYLTKIQFNEFKIINFFKKNETKYAAWE